MFTSSRQLKLSLISFNFRSIFYYLAYFFLLFPGPFNLCGPDELKLTELEPGHLPGSVYYIHLLLFHLLVLVNSGGIRHQWGYTGILATCFISCHICHHTKIIFFFPSFHHIALLGLLVWWHFFASPSTASELCSWSSALGGVVGLTLILQAPSIWTSEFRRESSPVPRFIGNHIVQWE